jgi:alkylation response protein AidB-like acyl-CoA dehydrogenase
MTATIELDLSEEQQLLRETVRDFAEKELLPQAIAIDREARFPLETFRKMAELGLLGLPIPAEYEGAGVDSVSMALVIEELARCCGSTALGVAAHTSLCLWPIFSFGTEEQRRRWVPDLASGRRLGAFGLTEPDAGSDAGGTRTTAVRQGDHYVLNGAKLFITNANYAQTFVVTALTDSSLGDEGHGFANFMKTLDGGRIGIGSLAVGLAQGAYERSVRYAQERQAFGKTISEQQGVAFKLADMAVQIDAARLLVRRAALLRDAGRPFGREAAMAKLFASEIAMKVTFDAIQVHGGYGFTCEYHVERMYRDAKLCTIGEGTSEIQRLVISRDILKDGP